MTNVILLTVDALRADHLPCYGYDRDTAPLLSELADENTLFTEAYSASSHTREAVPSILTGHCPTESTDPDYRLDAPTFASKFDTEDVRTAGFHSNPYVSRAYGFGAGFDEFDDDLYLGRHRLVALAQRAWDKLRNRHYARAEEINKRALEWIDDCEGDSFVLWNHYMDVHGPYEPIESYRKQFHDGQVSDSEAQELYKKAIRTPNQIIEEERQRLIDLYDAEIRYTDDQINYFFDELEARDLLSDTLVIITSDHGDAFGERGYYEHPRQLHDELVYIPLIAVGPDVPEATIDTPVNTVDLVPTMLDVFGKTDESLAGTPLQWLWDDPDTSRNRISLSEARGMKDESDIRRYAVRDGSETHFYQGSIEDDPGPSEQGELAAVLRTHILNHGEYTEATEPQMSQTEADEAVEDRLEALGYK